MYAFISYLECIRHLSLWHDHSVVLSRGYILVTLSVIFDEAVFDVSLYDERKHGVKLQEYVEQPEIYMICMSSSSVDDQAAIIPDRLKCLSSLSQPLISSNGVEVNDVLHFFVGDHKAIAFEQGAQCGGNFPCGTCGIHVSKFTDQTLALHRRVRSLQDIQNLATSARFGKRLNIVRPFENLTMGEIQTELHLRGCIDVDMPKAQLVAKLKSILEGVQRVPQSNLQRYSILPCEPLHDLKGHLNNLLPNVPTLLTGELKTNVHDLIQKCVYWKDSGHTGADMRVGLLRVYSMLINAVESGRLSSNSNVLDLIQTAVTISHILYSPPSERTSRNVLRLYNMCWLHHELCLSLFPSLIGTKFFGLYYYSLLIHGPVQYEIVCLRSINTEANERMFNSVKVVADQCTNRHPDNVVTKVLSHVQSKQIENSLIGSEGSLQNQDNRVSKESNFLPCYKGTVIPDNYIESHKSSFPAHLERISNFLIPGPSVWWEKGNGTVVFRDGDKDLCFREQGPSLRHFRSSCLTDVQHTAAEVWNELLKVDIALPLCDKDIRVFDTSGNFTGYRSTMNTNVDNVDNESNMSMDNSTTQLVSTPKPSIGIADDNPHNPMDVTVPSDLEGDYVVVGYVDNDAQQPKECFQNTEVDLKTSCGRILLELLGYSDSLTSNSS